MVHGIIMDGDETVINNDIKISYLEENILKYMYKVLCYRTQQILSKFFAKVKEGQISHEIA